MLIYILFSHFRHQAFEHMLHINSKLKNEVVKDDKSMMYSFEQSKIYVAFMSNSYILESSQGN